MYLLSAHWIADFVLQSDWMAINKSKSWSALGSHILVYALVIGVSVAVLERSENLTKFVLLNSLVHFVQDAITSRVAAQLYETRRHDFFVIIGLDQVLHLSLLVWTASYFTILTTI